MSQPEPKQVELLPLQEDDIDMLIGWRSRPEAQLHQPISSLGREHLVRFIKSRVAGEMITLLDHDYIIIIRDAVTSEPLGWMTMEISSRAHGLMRMGYTIDLPFWGQGYATASVQALMRMMFTKTKIGRIEADCSIDNPGSRRVLEKCGFSLVGIKHSYLIIREERVDHFYFEMTKQNYLLAHPEVLL